MQAPTLKTHTVEDLFGSFTLRQPLVVAYGMGVDSTAVLVRFAQLGIRPDLILFADVGGEKAETYAYLETINAFLEAHGMPQVTVHRGRGALSML